VYQFLHEHEGQSVTVTLTTLSKSPSALPRFVQISEFLAREIAAGRLIAGQRLAPERQMAKDLNVSVGTLRKALKRLENLGLIEPVQGSGNYIKQNNVVGSVYAMFRLELLQGGGLPRADVLSVSLEMKPEDLPEFGRSQRASRVRRLRYLNDTIMAVEEIWLDEKAGVVDPSALSDSLYQYYRTRLNIWISRAEDYVTIGHVPSWAPDLFPLECGSITG
jgi:GntR family transcriptional regulator